MRRMTAAMLACVLLAATAGVASAAKPATRGFLPAHAQPLGNSLVEIGTAFNHWAFATPADTNPLLAVRCEQSPLDPRIWFLPVSLGGETEATCEVPRGAFLVLTPGGWECSSIEPEPFFGANESELQECVDEGFDLLSYAEVTFNGKTTTDLDDYVVIRSSTPCRRTTCSVRMPASPWIRATTWSSIRSVPARTRCVRTTNSSRWNSRPASRSRSLSADAMEDRLSLGTRLTRS